MKRSTIAIAVVLLTSLIFAEDKAPSKFVRVAGTAEVKVVPDRAVIELGVERQNASAAVAKQSADAVARRILESLHANGVDEKDIQTTYLSLRPQSNYHKGVRTASYFVAQQTLSVTVRDLSKLDTLLQGLIAAGGNRIDSVEYETSDLRKYRDQARELAVKAAREKAQAMAHALGQEIGKAQSIEEATESRGYGLANNYIEEGGFTRKSPSTSAGQARISASVTVSFELN
ncbi:MAG TPA: SIMPL domain-containing protein [Candidatus Angelobacter sp.]|nr:SIMPL domain-containing protein [Candidatus Angelobacter sp.]